MTNLVILVTGNRWILFNPLDQQRGWHLFFKTKPKLLIASPPLLISKAANHKVLAKVEMAANMSASASSWKHPCLKRSPDFSGIYAVDSDLQRIYSNSESPNELIFKLCPTESELDLCRVFY